MLSNIGIVSADLSIFDDLVKHCIFQIFFKVLYERSCNSFFRRAPYTYASVTRKFRTFFFDQDY